MTDTEAATETPTPRRPLATDDDPAYRRRLLAVVMLAVMGFGTLMTVVTVSLSVIAEDLDSSRTTLGWIVTGLMLTMAVLTPTGGKLGDIYGHRKVFLIGLAGSVVTTALCGFAWNAASLIGARVLFGVTGALVQPNGMSMMMRAFGPERRATAMGWFQFATTGAPTIGLVIGGPLVDVIGWRPLFFIFSGVALLALGLGSLLLRETVRGPATKLDIEGAVSLAVTVLCFLLAVTRIARTGFDLWTLLLVCGFAAGIAAFIWAERRAPFPMLRLDYFKRRNFVAPLVASALNQFAYMGGFVVTPLLLDDVYGYAVGAVALIMVPRPGAFAISSPLGGLLASKLGERIPMVAASLLMIGSMVCFAAGARPGVLLFVIAGLTLSGLSAGIGAPSFSSLAAGAVDQRDLGVANGMSQTMLFMGIVSGIQIMLVVLGEDPTQGRFATTYLFGAGVAVLGLLTGLLARPSRRA